MTACPDFAVFLGTLKKPSPTHRHSYTSVVTTTIRVDENTRNQLARRAAEHNRSLGEELAAILENLRWQELEESVRDLRDDPRRHADRADYVAERDAWSDADLGDGLAETAADEYPEYQAQRPEPARQADEAR